VEGKIFKAENLISQDILKHIKKKFGRVVNISKSDIALSNDVFFVDTVNQKLVLKIFKAKNKFLFNINNHEVLINYFAAKNITPFCLFFNHKYAVFEYIEGIPLQADNLHTDFPNIIKEIHNAELNINKRNFFKTAGIYCKKISPQYLKNELLQEALRQSFNLLETINKFKPEIALCHNDLNPNNFIQSQNKLYILDFEYASINDKYFDFASIKTLLNKNNFANFIQKYDIILNDAKLHAYGCLINFISSLWCFMMGYYEMGEQSAMQMLKKIKDLS